MVAPALSHVPNPADNTNPDQAEPDALAALQVRIARRADEIAAVLPGRTPLNLYCWLQAEQEILAAMRVLDQPAKSSA